MAGRKLILASVDLHAKANLVAVMEGSRNPLGESLVVNIGAMK